MAKRLLKQLSRGVVPLGLQNTENHPSNSLEREENCREVMIWREPGLLRVLSSLQEDSCLRFDHIEHALYIIPATETSAI